ncbi:MAG: heme-degrading domain-containing protein [Devosia sp.]|uniref:heme-degrading domain-containing protein n=1 Tax=Devosia sp. 66-22 TaxID=1895753 RepID=UPI000929843E|nr:heme-degrading domain-containing protein [Devosia sp. 66-22]MBN9347037.1 heme-degrading domain-containing protein [Devosia sp.]OJX50765.1 MAG: hypothetical protein BGO81_21225 [Devosia sp. 66-22]
MSTTDDIEKVAEQERLCMFTAFDEATALAIGSRIGELARAAGKALAIDIRFWNRQLYFQTMPGTSADNLEWIRRKSNFVRRYNRSSYSQTLRFEAAGKTGFAFDDGVDDMEVAAHGGSFPIRIAGVGIVGAITVSGVPGRYDHGFVVEAICAHLGIDYGPLALE